MQGRRSPGLRAGQDGWHAGGSRWWPFGSVEEAARRGGRKRNFSTTRRGRRLKGFLCEEDQGLSGQTYRHTYDRSVSRPEAGFRRKVRTFLLTRKDIFSTGAQLWSRRETYTPLERSKRCRAVGARCSGRVVRRGREARRGLGSCSPLASARRTTADGRALVLGQQLLRELGLVETELDLLGERTRMLVTESCKLEYDCWLTSTAVPPLVGGSTVVSHLALKVELSSVGE